MIGFMIGLIKPTFLHHLNAFGLSFHTVQMPVANCG